MLRRNMKYSLHKLTLVASLMLFFVSTTFASGIRGSPIQQSVEHNEQRHLFQFSSECNYSENPPYYVSPRGNNWGGSWGLSPERPFKTIQHAVDQRADCQIIYIMEGLYRNNYYGNSLNHNNKIVNLNNVHNLKILAYGGNTSRPVLEFDGPGGIFGGSASSPISNIEIAGLEIIGPNESITWSEAMENRIIKRTHYNGRGIAIWAGHHIFIHDMVVHHCPASGIRVNRGDYVTISDNRVYSNTWWSSSAESGLVLATSKNIDNFDGIKMILTNNVVYDNVNKIPYYNVSYLWDYSPIGNKDCSIPACEQELQECPWECRYGKKTQDYIIDGMGVYVTRNKDTYLHGKMELSYNTCYKNGINGLSFHRTDRGIVKQNIIYDNGVVPRLDKEEKAVEDWHAGCNGKSRQPYSGLVINNADEVKLWSNNVAARYADDYAFKQEYDGSPSPLGAGGNNQACQGLVDPNLGEYVNVEDDLEVCGVKYLEIHCGEKCHLIQWPYTMISTSYSPSDAYEECSRKCDEGDCRAFSLQDDYRPGNDGMKFCFVYKDSQDPSPLECQNDPFNQNQPQCSYVTTNGQFFITPTAKAFFNVNDKSF